jgi:hypothetical protein
LSELQSKIIAVMAVLPPKEREELEVSMAKLEDHSHGVADALDRVVTILARFLDVLAKSPPEEKAPQADTLCGTCANPCPRAEDEEVKTCPRYHEKTKKCLSCYYWDTDPRTGGGFCALAGPCRGGSAYAPRSEEIPV